MQKKSKSQRSVLLSQKSSKGDNQTDGSTVAEEGHFTAAKMHAKWYSWVKCRKPRQGSVNSLPCEWNLCIKTVLTEPLMFLDEFCQCFVSLGKTLY